MDILEQLTRLSTGLICYRMLGQSRNLRKGGIEISVRGTVSGKKDDLGRIVERAQPPWASVIVLALKTDRSW